MSREFTGFDKNYEICLPSFWDDPIKLIPENLQVIFEQNIPNVVMLLKQETDYAHNFNHTIEGVAGLSALAPIFELSDQDLNKAHLTFRCHDLGYFAVKMKLIEHTNHHLASIYIANKLTDDKSILCAVANHNKDVLPYDTPLWARAVSNVDKALLHGFVGIARSLLYVDGLDQSFTNGIATALNDGSLFDPSHPLSINHDKEVKKFFLTNILPYLTEYDHLVNLSVYCKKILSIVHGYSWNEWYVPIYERGATLDGILSRHMEWQFEPVLREVETLFSKRTAETHFVRQYIRKLAYEMAVKAHRDYPLPI